MSKYDALWKFVQEDGRSSVRLSFVEIQNITGVAIDHSFLRYKKDLIKYGYEVGKISMKEQMILFHKLN